MRFCSRSGIGFSSRRCLRSEYTRYFVEDLEPNTPTVAPCTELEIDATDCATSAWWFASGDSPGVAALQASAANILPVDCDTTPPVALIHTSTSLSLFVRA